MAETKAQVEQRGWRKGSRWAISWLHKRAEEMNDPAAKAILNTAAFQLGVEAKTTQSVPSGELMERKD